MDPAQDMDIMVKKKDTVCDGSLKRTIGGG